MTRYFQNNIVQGVFEINVHQSITWEAFLGAISLGTWGTAKRICHHVELCTLTIVSMK
jgi:hypothetical protein